MDTTQLRTLIASRDYTGIAVYCESALLSSARSAGGGHPHYIAHVLALIALDRLECARHLWRQRHTLAPLPLTPPEALATQAAQAAWRGDAVTACTALTSSSWREQDVLGDLANTTAEELRARGRKRVARAYRVASVHAVSELCAVPVEDVGLIAEKMGWKVDGVWVTPVQGVSDEQRGEDGMQRVGELANHLVKMKTTL